MTESEQIVYISCVEEVRYSFISHLSEALRRKGIHDVFVDCDDLLSDESQSKVERARVSLMVLPGNHTVNLDKLAEVLECQKNKDQVVIPVLYGVRSLDSEWLIALDSKGFSSVHYSRMECSDSQLVKEIVRDVYEKLFHTGRIGIYSKLLEIEKMVCKQPLNIRCVGIWGMPGIGKTTLAKAVFDQLSGEFDAYCFIEDYTKAIQEKGLYRLLEEQFLKEKAVAGGTNAKLSFLRDKLNNKRVLVVLDDVCNPLAVESFLGGFDWFGPKSLIIITSRDKQVFRLCRVNQIYEVQGLNEKEALQLFSLCASIDDMAEQNLHEVSMKVIKYANGHPLALNLYGRELKDKKKPQEMETAFLELMVHPPNKFVDAIKSSYETLNDSCRNIFLDIACFFQGENVDYVIQLLEGCGFFPHVGIDILVEKCLVTVSENLVCMHNLIQDVGRQIGRRSRLWEPWSIKYLLEDNEHNVDVELKATLKRVQGTEEIESMFLDTSNLSFNIKPAAFDNMLNLRLLKIYCSNPEIHPVISFPDGYIRSLPNELRLLHWENYPLRFLPVNFDPMHLVEINMPYSQLCRLWDGTKNLEMLRTIRLCHSQQLVDIDDLLKAPNLEVIDLQGCTRLQNLPATGQLLHLRVVNLSGCTEIKSFPEIPPNIETLHLQGTCITELPLSIGKPNYRELLNLLAEIPGLSGVSNLEQSDLKPLTSLMKMGTSNKNLGKLISLELKDCSRLRSLPDMDNLELIKVLDLSGCLELETIQGFPRNLKELYLAGTAVRQVPQLPQSLEIFNAHGCVSLKSIRLDFEKLPVHYTFSNCFDLSPQVVSDFLVKALANAQHLSRERQQELNEAPAFSLCVPSHENQNSTLDLQPGSSVMTRLNSSWKNTLVGFAMLVEVAFSEDYYDATGFGIRCVCRWKNKEGHSHSIERNLHCWAPGKAVPKVQKDHMFVLCDVNMRPSTDEGNGPDILADLIVFEFFPVNKQTKPLPDSCIVKRCGVRVITGSNTSRYDVSPVLSLDPMEVSGNENEEVLRISYDGLQEMGKALFLYIVGLFNDEDVGLVAPHIAKIIDMDVSNGLKVLADRSLIRVSSNGEIVMPCFLRQMGEEILHTESKKIERLGDNSMINTRIIENTRYIHVNSSFPPMSPEEEEIFNKLSSPNTIDHEQGLIQLRKTTRSDASSRISLCTERILSLLRSLIISRYNIVQTNAAASIVNLSLEKPNKLKIVRSGFVPLLIDVLKSGSTEAQEHVIGALFSLAIEEENKMAIGILGAVEPLLHALRSSESERARQDAALALYHLSLIPNNRTRLVKAGAVPMMLSMIRSGESASRILLLLCNLAACLEGNGAMLDGNAVAILAAKLRECGGVESEAAARENCVEALLTLSAGNMRFRGLASEAGLEEVLTEIVESESGSGRLKEKAAKILQSMRGGDREFGGAEAREWNRKLGASELSRSQFQGGQKGGFAYSSQF